MVCRMCNVLSDPGRWEPVIWGWARRSCGGHPTKQSRPRSSQSSMRTACPSIIILHLILVLVSPSWALRQVIAGTCTCLQVPASSDRQVACMQPHIPHSPRVQDRLRQNQGLIQVAYSPASSSLFLGSPSIVRVPATDVILCSHDTFYPGQSTFVHASKDRGATWTHLSTVLGQYWSTLFTVDGEWEPAMPTGLTWPRSVPGAGPTPAAPCVTPKGSEPLPCCTCHCRCDIFDGDRPRRKRRFHCHLEVH